MYILKMGDLESAEACFKELDGVERKDPYALNGDRRLLAVLRAQIKNAKTYKNKALRPIKPLDLKTTQELVGSGYAVDLDGTEVNFLGLAARGIIVENVQDYLVLPPLRQNRTKRSP